MDNHIYNLFSQLVQDKRSVYRIRKFYIQDAKRCKKCQGLWKRILNEKEKQIEDILKLIKEHKF